MTFSDRRFLNPGGNSVLTYIELPAIPNVLSGWDQTGSRSKCTVSCLMFVRFDNQSVKLQPSMAAKNLLVHLLWCLQLQTCSAGKDICSFDFANPLLRCSVSCFVISSFLVFEVPVGTTLLKSTPLQLRSVVSFEVSISWQYCQKPSLVR